MEFDGALGDVNHNLLDCSYETSSDEKHHIFLEKPTINELWSIFPAIYFYPRLANVGSESAKKMGKQPGA